MNKEELISIIVPVFNVSTYLKACIESVIKQTYTSWELLLIDDESTDGSGIMCDEWAKSDKRIRVIHKQHSGAAESRNVGISNASGAYIYFIDSDDWIEPDTLQTMICAINKYKVDIVVAGAFFDYPNRTKRVSFSHSDNILSREDGLKLIITGQIPSYLWLFLFRRKVIQEPYENYPCFEDYATGYKWFSHAESIAVIPSAKYHYIQRAGSILHSQRRDDFMLEILVQRHHYIKQHHLIDEVSNRVNTVRNLVKLAKDFSRKPIQLSEKKEFANKISNVLIDYLPVTFFQLGLKRWIRLKLLLHAPNLFHHFI